ncbi:MAG: alpha/beta hydrolase [Bacteroidota bacterium]|nr:alpha/beta hydrolase [Bacteroidota bacterium]
MLFIIILAAVIFTFLISATVILFFVGPTLLLQPRRRTAEFYRKLGKPITPNELNLPYEEINIATTDNINLHCWLIKANRPAKGTLIYLHGVADCKIDGLRFANISHAQGYNVFLYDSRRHGYSGGKYCTYGEHEKFDVVQIIDYLFSRSDLSVGKIGLFGTSMGAAVAIQSAAIDSRIAAVAAENSFATLRTIFDDYQKRMIKLPFHYLRNLVIIHSELRAKFKASQVSPLESISNIHIPILFIYGTADHLIKHQYSILLYECANQPKEIYPIEGASHNNIWEIAGIEYEQRLLNFFEKNLQ